MNNSQPWEDGNTTFPGAYEPTTIMGDGWARCLNPQSRTGGVTYDTPPYDALDPGAVFHGIGCSWKETGITTPTVEYEWAGYHTAPHLETSPLLHVNEASPLLGIGVWTSTLFGAQVLYVGTIGNPPELFNVIDIAPFSTPNATTTQVSMSSNGARVWPTINGKTLRLNINGDAGVPIPAPLLGSTKHGVAFDTHLTAPVDIPNYNLWRNWTCTPNGAKTVADLRKWYYTAGVHGISFAQRSVWGAVATESAADAEYDYLMDILFP